MTMQSTIRLTFVIASMSITSASSADMTGATISFSSVSGMGADPAAWTHWDAERTFTVGAGVEYSYAGIVDIDFSANSIRMDFNLLSYWVGPLDYNGWVIRDATGTLTDFAGITLSETVGTSWGPVVATVYDADTILLNFAGTNTPSQTLLFSPGDYGIFSVSFVPTPGSIAVLGAVGLLGTRSRRKG